MVGDYLGGAGFEVEAARRRAPGAQRCGAPRARSPYDALVLDLMLPDGDGLELCRALRADATRARDARRSLMLTARGETTDRIVGLELGADDYLPKPFNPRELLARLRALLRRARARRAARRRAALRPARDRPRRARRRASTARRAR